MSEATEGSKDESDLNVVYARVEALAISITEQAERRIEDLYVYHLINCDQADKIRNLAYTQMRLLLSLVEKIAKLDAKAYNIIDSVDPSMLWDDATEYPRLVSPKVDLVTYRGCSHDPAPRWRELWSAYNKARTQEEMDAAAAALRKFDEQKGFGKFGPYWGGHR